MKNTNYIINGILAVAVIVLFILHFSGKKTGVEKAVLGENDSSVVALPVAYVNVDSMLLNYHFAKELNDVLESKREKLRLSLNQKGQQLSAEMVEFENKLNNNIFATRERAISEQQRLEKKQRDLQEFITRSQEELEIEHMRVNQQLADTVIVALNIYNESKRYQIIFRNAGIENILLANEAYNITREVLDFLNARYQPEKK